MEAHFMSKQNSGINTFQRYLSVWVILCMAAGVLIGKFLPQIPEFLSQFEYASGFKPTGCFFNGS